MNRRHFLLNASALGFSSMLAPLAWAEGEHADHMMHMNHGGGASDGMAGLKVVPDMPLLPETALPAGRPHRALARLANTAKQRGVVKATLTAAAHDVELVAGQTTPMWLYNGQVPGPLIEAFEGDRVEIRFINQLAQPSTIHWHGMPVPPDQDGNPQDAVPAGGERLYQFTLPKGSAGTYWYHPHPHGDTPEQVYRGLAGLFIVRAKDDPLLSFSEQHWVISDLKLDAEAKIPDNTANDWMNGREGQFVLINGQHQPVMNILGRQRIRIWNACSARYLRLAIPGQKLTLVGTDGGLLEKPEIVPEVLLVPGQRVEILLGDGKAQHAELKALIYDRQKMGRVAPEVERTLAKLQFNTGAVPNTPKLLRKISDPGKATALKKVEFSETMSMENGQHTMSFMVNGKIYDMDRVDLISKAGEVEIWQIFNNSHMDHPFHLHGTQFIVLDSELEGKRQNAPYRALHDTVNLRPYETLRIKVVQHDKGLRMFHCHILEHEGQGMMAQVKVI
ncbi:multicopper oxidase family protein [Chitinibacter bivalviorum]|uniref:Multicopper oxidase family protein n=1 Tax=Chitinibacter bivalviorum TaxID=2739434 RepID=A0A7H9BEF7_9NEIS|nr:multicopper oxidase family protein [Chitinibacter bivalviorum]QLG86917.1 multicopper oxidase family protein [Chitinibacter bivalviorum]